jgi:hypothetical protein
MLELDWLGRGDESGQDINDAGLAVGLISTRPVRPGPFDPARSTVWDTRGR